MLAIAVEEAEIKKAPEPRWVRGLLGGTVVPSAGRRTRAKKELERDGNDDNDADRFLTNRRRQLEGAGRIESGRGGHWETAICSARSSSSSSFQLVRTSKVYKSSNLLHYFGSTSWARAIRSRRRCFGFGFAAPGSCCKGSAMGRTKVAAGAWWLAGLTLGLVALGGCHEPTSFEGKAKFPGGVNGCRRQCASRELEMASFIYIGEYSSACACKPRAAAGQLGSQTADGDAAIAAAAAGVELQRRVAEQQQRAATHGVVGAALPH
jgi:hypothetical protein